MAHLFNPLTLLMTGFGIYMLFSVIRAATAGGRDLAELARTGDARAIPVVATFAGVRGFPALFAIASNNARPLFAVGPSGIDYRVIRKRRRAFSEIEHIDVLKSWRTVNVEFRFRGAMLTLAVNAGTDPAARTILKSLPDDAPMTPRARILRDG